MRLLFTLTAFAIMAACTTTSKITTKQDDFSGGKILKTDVISIVDKILTPEEKKAQQTLPTEQQKRVFTKGFSISFSKIVTNNVAEYRALVIDGSEGSHPVAINKKEGLQFNIDGEIIKLSTDEESASSESKTPGVFAPLVTQSVEFKKIPESLIKKLAEAKSIRVRIEGTRSEKNGLLAAIGKEAIANLLKSN